jgi:XTP/dITP diphosphohydrolase
MKLVLGTSNPGKIRELRALLAPLPLELITAADLGLNEEPEEGAGSFAENALLKARFYYGQCGLPTLAEDSGLEVDALGGEPGIFSRRYAGEGATDGERIQLLLSKMQGIPPGRRRARFRSAIALVVDSNRQYLFGGSVEGLIAEEPRGTEGFGYDPIFLLPELGRTMAELSLEEKNRISHRARAAAGLAQFLKGWLSKTTAPEGE